MPDKRACNPSCLRCWRNKLKHAAAKKHGNIIDITDSYNALMIEFEERRQAEATKNRYRGGWSVGTNTRSRPKWMPVAQKIV
jgi:hypothetical protein